MTQHFLVYFKAGTNDVMAVYTNNEETPITRDVLKDDNMDMDVQEFTIETETYVSPDRLYREIQSKNGVVTFKRGSTVQAIPVEQTTKRIIPRRIAQPIL